MKTIDRIISHVTTKLDLAKEDVKLFHRLRLTNDNYAQGYAAAYEDVLLYLKTFNTLYGSDRADD